MFRLVRRLGAPRIYLMWAQAWLRLYQAMAWSRGSLGTMFDKLLPR